MHPRVVLVEPRRHLVLGILDREPLRVQDALARRVVLPEEAARRNIWIESCEV